MEAFEIAANAHDKQYRKYNKKPYITHPLAVAKIIEREFELKNSNITELTLIALLHDVLEDDRTKTYTFEMLREKFGYIVANAVLTLTKKHNDHLETHDEEYFNQIMESGRQEIYIVKTADRIHNIRDLAEWTDFKKRAIYLEETKKYVLPIALRAGTKPYTLLLEEVVKYAR